MDTIVTVEIIKYGNAYLYMGMNNDGEMVTTYGSDHPDEQSSALLAFASRGYPVATINEGDSDDGQVHV